MYIIDIHNHSLPFMDDGAKSLDMAIDMLRVAESTGTKEVVLTPHHLNGVYTNFCDQILNQAENLRREAIKHKIAIKIHTASEVHLVPETVEHLLEKKALTYCQHGKAALVELPKHNLPVGVESILSELVHHSITPIIAHPERNSSLRSDFGPLREWIELGCKAQVTGQSCTGAFGKELQQATFSMISENLVHFVASDAHRPLGRSPDLSEAIRVIAHQFGDELSSLLFADNPARLIAGESLMSAVNICLLSSNKNSTKKSHGWLDRLKNLK